MRQRTTTRRVAASIAAIVGLIAGPLVLVSNPAGATSGAQTYQYDCATTSPVAGNQTVPVAVTFNGTVSDSAADGTADAVSHTGSVDVDTTLAVSLPSSLIAQIQTQIVGGGGTLDSVSVVVNSAATAATNADPTSVPAPGSPLTPSSQVPDATNGNTFVFPSAIVGTTDANGAPGSSMDFSGGAMTASIVFELGGGLAALSPLTLNGAGCVINDQDGVLDAGEAQATDAGGAPLGVPVEFSVVDPSIVGPGVAYASATIVNAAPTITTTSVPSVAGVTQNLTIQGTDADGDALQNWAVSSASCTDDALSSVALTPVSTTNTSATYSFAAPLNTADYACSFTADVEDVLGAAATQANITINVVAGDSVTQDVTVQLDTGVLDLAGTGTIDFGAFTLTGVNFTTQNEAINQLTISDGRGVPAAWTLTAELQGDLVNPAYTGDPNGVIGAENLTMENIVCARTADGGVGVDPAGGAGGTLDSQVVMCTAASGSNTGQFTADAEVNLFVPGSSYSGNYTATVEFIAS